MNTYLKIAVLCLSFVAMGQTILLVKAVRALSHIDPLIVRINEIGRADALARSAFEYTPQEPEIKYFLIRFVQEHYGRMRATVKENFSNSLSFLEARLADSVMDAQRKSQSIEQVIAGIANEVDIKVNNVTIEDLRKAPYRATLDYERIYYDASSRREVRREKYVGSFVFVVKEHVPHAMIPVNPLGLTITYFREDQAFQ